MSEERPTIYDVARHADVSISSVSKVLNDYPHVGEDVRRRVEESVQALEYEPSQEARQLGRRSRTAARLRSRQSLRLCLVGAARKMHLSAPNLQVTASLSAEELMGEGSLPGAPDAVVCALPEDEAILRRAARRARESALPLVALLKKEKPSEAEALAMGADVAARRSEEELLESRLRAWHRSHRRVQSHGKEGVLEVGRLQIDRFRRRLEVDGKAMAVTSKELLMLEVLAEHPGRVRSRKELGERAWPEGEQPAEATINMHVSKVRGKLRERGVEEGIETVRGVGYRLNPDALKPSKIHKNPGAG